MAGRLLAVGSQLCGKRLVPIGTASAYHDHHKPPDYLTELKNLIGDREIVGHGINGEPSYVDRPDFPFPSVRWKDNTPDVIALHQKEKGDWRKLTIEEKKALYRATFCQTFTEFQAPTGEWKTILGGTFTVIGVALWGFILFKLFVAPPLPESFSEESQRAQLRRMLDARMEHITGISSKWDYEKNDWKKK